MNVLIFAIVIKLLNEVWMEDHFSRNYMELRSTVTAFLGTRWVLSALSAPRKAVYTQSSFGVEWVNQIKHPVCPDYFLIDMFQ